MKIRHIFITILVLAMATSCVAPEQQQPVTTEADVEAINDSLAQWLEAANAQDPERMLTLVTDDLEWLPPGQEAVVGADAYQGLRSYFEQFTLHAKHDNREIVVGGDIGYVRYAYELNLTPKAGGEPVIVKGHGIRIFHRQVDGSWKQAKDVWTSVPLPSDET